MRLREVTLASRRTVWAPSPYAPKLDIDFVGRVDELRMIQAAWRKPSKAPPLSPLLVGRPGAGKNRIVYEASRQFGNAELYIMQGHDDLTPEDLVCTVRFADHDNSRLEYVLSPLAAAMIEGKTRFIDEIGKIRNRALALLVSVLDERRYLQSTLLGEYFEAQAGFRFVAATNTGEVDSLPDYIRSRMQPVIDIDYPRDQEIEELVKNIPRAEHLLKEFWRLFRGAHVRPTPRQVIHLFAFAEGLHERRGPTTEGYSQDNTDPINPASLAEAFDELITRRRV